MKKIIPIVVIVSLVMGFKFFNKWRVGNEARGNAIESIESVVPGIDHDYLVDLVSHHHDAAMEQAYQMGGRREGSTFDERTYRVALYSGMATEALAEGKVELVAALAGRR